MAWKFWQSSEPRALPHDVQVALQSQFRLDEETTNRMRLLGKHGRYAGRRVRFLKVFDPTLIKDGHPLPVKFDNFLKNQIHREALLFEGHSEKDGVVHLSDRRPSIKVSGAA